MLKFRIYEKIDGNFSNKYCDLNLEIEHESTLATLAMSMKADELEKFFVTVNNRPGEIFQLSKWLYISNASKTL